MRRGTEPLVPTSTSALSHAMLAGGAMSEADSYGAALISATPRSVSASGIAVSTARVLFEVPALGVLDFITGFRATPLHPVHYGSDALHRVVLGGHRAQPTTITSLTLWEHMVLPTSPRLHPVPHDRANTTLNCFLLSSPFTCLDTVELTIRIQSVSPLQAHVAVAMPIIE